VVLKKLLFQTVYWATSILAVLLALPLLLLPGRKLLMKWLQFYAHMMVFWMHRICGISVEIRGRENIPDGPCIIASKHQSWGDGFAIFSQIPDLAIVTGDHLEKIPLVGFILRKMEAVVVDSCGGAQARARLVDEELSRAKVANRKMLIYPEGHLAPVGYHFRYRKGVFFMYEGYGCPVVPVATNLGLCWPQSSWTLQPGIAVIQFLKPIQPGLDKEAFMGQLQERIEAASLALLPQDFPVPENRELEFDVESDRGVPTTKETQKKTA